MRQIGALFRLSSEKLDLIRACAGTALSRVLHNQGGQFPLPGVDSLATLRSIIPPPIDAAAVDVTGAGPTTDLSSSSVSKWFRTIAPVLSLDEYVLSVMAGLVTSVGGLSESVVRARAGSACTNCSRLSRLSAHAGGQSMGNVVVLRAAYAGNVV